MSDTFSKGSSDAAGLNQAFAGKLDAAAAVMAGTSAGFASGPLANRPTAPGDFTFYGVTDLEQLQVFIGGAWYVIAGAAASGATAPGPALNLAMSSKNTTSVGLTWQAPSVGTGPFVFGVEFRVSGTTAWSSFTNTQALAANVTGLQANTQYDFKIVTTGQTSPPSDSAILQVTTTAVAPSKPTSVAAGTVTGTSAALSWATPTSGTPPYAYTVTAVAGATTITSPPLSDTTYTLTGLAPSTTYSITVAAANAGGTATSDALVVTTGSAASVGPSAPTNLVAANVTTGGFDLSWAASASGTGIVYQPEWGAVSGSASGVVREPIYQPGSAQSVWNTPMGSGATFSAMTDADQIALTSLSCAIAYGAQHGTPVWIGQSTDPQITITSPTVASSSTRNWWENTGGDGTFWVAPMETTASFITSGTLIDTLRNGVGNSSPTGYLHLPPDYSVPWYVGTSSDPLVTVTDGTKSIQVHIPVGATIEQPYDVGSDSSIGGCDRAQPYLVWSISGAKMYDASGAEIYTLTGPGCTIRGAYGLQVDDGSGQMMMDIITGQPGTNNSFGNIQEYDLLQALADDNYVMQHMIAYMLDAGMMSNVGPIWPLKVIDTSFPNNGLLPQGLTIAIPPGTAYPSGKVGNRAFKFLWDNAMQYGWFYYNQSGTKCTSICAYPMSTATQNFCQLLKAEMNDIMSYMSILKYQSGVAGAQYSAATQKGRLAGQPSNPAFTPPAPLDLSPTAGKNVSPSTFGAWYPSGYNVTPNNTPPSSGTQYQRDNGLTATVHCPANATIGGDNNSITLFDMTQPNKVWSGVQCTYNNGTNVSGGITCQRFETDLTCSTMEDTSTGNFGYDRALGLIRNFDLAQGKINHTLAWLGDPKLMSGSPAAWDQNIAYPDTHADYGRPGYTGSIQPGATIAIPPGVNLDSLGLTQGGRMLADALQQRGAIWRGTMTGGVTFPAELNIEAQYLPLLQQMQQDAPKLLSLLRIVRNQSASTKNGGGTPLYTAPPPLDAGVCPGSSGGNSGGAPSTFQPIGQPTTGTTAKIVGLQPNTRYAFEVVATNSVGSAASVPLYVTTAVSGSIGGGTVTPTTTWNSATAGGPMTFSADKLTAFSGGSTTAGAAPQGCLSTSSKTTGIFWFEVTATKLTTDFAVGVANATFNLTEPAGLGSDANGLGYYSVSPTQAVYYAGNGLTYGNTADANGAPITCVVDVDKQLFWVTTKAMRAAVGAKAWNNSLSANPATGAGGLSFAGLSGPIFICFNDLEGGAQAVLNTGASAPSITIPSGVQPWDPGTSTGGGGGTSTGKPTVQGPSTETVTASGAVSVTGVTITDSAATGSCTLNLACSQGTLTATVGGSPVKGSGTNSITYTNTFANVQAVAASLVYTAATAAGTDSIGVTFTDNLGQAATIHIPVTITANTNPQLLPAGPISTLGAQLVDQNGNPVRVCSVGWNWYEGPTGIPAGLDTLSYKDMFNALVSNGINCVQIGVSMASVNRNDAFPSGGSGRFQVKNGVLLDPSGKPFKAYGINVSDPYMSLVDASGGPFLTKIPGLNFIRLACFNNDNEDWASLPPSKFTNFVNIMTSLGVVVEIEDHAFPSNGSVATGSKLTAKCNWYAALATQFKNNPYVWFGTTNEPVVNNGTGSQYGVSVEHQAIVNAIRGTGNMNPIMIDPVAGGGESNQGFLGTNPTWGPGLDPTVYATMTNVLWDCHNYAGSQTTQSGIYASLQVCVGLAQQITSADGVMPVIIGEYGPSQDGLGDDNVYATLPAVQQSVGKETQGCVAWAWFIDSSLGDNLTDGNNNLTSQYGAQVAGWIKNQTGGVTAPPSTGSGVAGATGINYSLNPDLAGLAFNDALKTVIAYGRSLGLRFIIDWHNCEGTNTVNFGASNPNGLWYDVGGASNGTDGGGNTGTISQQTYVNLQTKIGQMFAGTDAVIGVNMINAPVFKNGSGATWGGYKDSSGETGVVGSNRDLRAALVTAGNALLAANPNLLVICEGIQDTGGSGTNSYAPEGAIQAAQSWPVSLSVANKVVYAGHIYPNEVNGASPDNGSAWISRLNREFGWLYTNNQGPPFFVSECGDNMRSSDGTTYANALIAYLNGQDSGSGGPAFTSGQKGVSWSWWDLGVVNTAVPGFGILSANAGGVDSVQQGYWDQMLYTASTGGGGGTGQPPLIQSPLTGTVTTGTWQYGDFQSAGMPSGYMHYALLLPHGYSKANRYPVLVYQHQNNEGNSWYQNGGDPTQNTIVFQDVIDGTFNTVPFRTDHPCIVIVPFCDQTDGLSGGGLNFGGYGDVPGQNVNENAVAGIVQYVWANYSCYQPKTFLTGQSLGGTGTIAQMLDYNRTNGPIGKIWTAGLCLSGQIVRSPNPVQDSATLARMASVPLFCIAGSGDNGPSTGANNNQYERPAWAHYAGNTNYPEPAGVMGGSIAGSKAGSSQYYYAEDTTLGHNTWSGNSSGHNYGLYPNNGKAFYDWLFSQEVA